MNTSISPTTLSGKDIRFESEKFFVILEDDREIGIPYSWFPRLHQATPEQLQNWRFIGKGEGIHWDDLDEDISIRALLFPGE